MSKSTASKLLNKWGSVEFDLTPELLPMLQDVTLRIRQLTIGEAETVSKLESENEQSRKMFSLCVSSVDEDGEVTTFSPNQVKEIPQRIVAVTSTVIHYFTGGMSSKSLVKLIELERDGSNPDFDSIAKDAELTSPKL